MHSHSRSSRSSRSRSRSRSRDRSRVGHIFNDRGPTLLDPKKAGKTIRVPDAPTDAAILELAMSLLVFGYYYFAEGLHVTAHHMREHVVRIFGYLMLASPSSLSDWLQDYARPFLSGDRRWDWRAVRDAIITFCTKSDWKTSVHRHFETLRRPSGTRAAVFFDQLWKQAQAIDYPRVTLAKILARCLSVPFETAEKIISLYDPADLTGSKEKIRDLLSRFDEHFDPPPASGANIKTTAHSQLVERDHRPSHRRKGKPNGQKRGPKPAKEPKHCANHPNATSHDTSECRKKPQPEASVPTTVAQQPTGTASPAAPMVCNFCNRKGHVESECYKKRDKDAKASRRK